MENQPVKSAHSSNPRRKVRSKTQIFKEVYLPYIILALVAIVIVGIIVAIVRGGKDPAGPNGDGDQTAQLQQEADALLQQAEALALSYDYDAALAVLATFQGDVEDFPEIENAINHYTAIRHNMVTWTAGQVANLSFHVLVEDLAAALADPTYGQEGSNLYNRNFVTTQEFSAILQRLYDDGYVLVQLSDLYDAGSEGYEEKQLKLPAGKKPLMLTETHCNYYSYMVDPDRDGQPDSNGAGFASKLCWNNGFYNEMVTSDGTTVTGAFDLVPILENFIQLHPEFSYKGARAILAFSGYDGVFGYRITSQELSDEALQQERSDAAALAQKLREAGYTIACYTYSNSDYSVKDPDEIQEDITLWQEQIAPVLGATDVLVFAREADIGTNYQGNEKFDVLYGQGYRFFLGSTPFLSHEVKENYVRHSRLLVTGSTLQHHSEWFDGIMDTAGLLDPLRGRIPQ